MRDGWVDVLIVLVLGIVAVATIGGGMVLALNDKDLPGELIALGAAAVGALSQRLPGSSARNVTVTNPPSNPIPVDPT